MLSCLCSCGGTNHTTIIGWALNSKDPTTYAYVITEVLSFFIVGGEKVSLYGFLVV
jgi:hypothetical protein